MACSNPSSRQNTLNKKKPSTRPANTLLIRSSAPVSPKNIPRPSSIHKNIKIIPSKHIPLDDIVPRNGRDPQTLTRKRRSQTRIIDHRNASGEILRVLSLPPSNEILLNSSPNGAVNTNSRSAKTSAPIRKSIGEAVPAQTHVFDSRIQESPNACVANIVVFNLRSVGLDAERDEIIRDPIPNDHHFREIVHA